MAEEMFGRYRLEALIGQGGMGEVWRAFDQERHRTVVLKRLPPRLSADADFTARFRRESEVTARLREPHIIPIHDFGEIDDQLFIDMRLVDGTDLDELIKQTGPLDPERAVRIIAQAASALDAAHADGLVHRDVKPSNILVSGELDFVYLVDFGVARAVSGAAPLTATGDTVGTMDYMAPERFHGRAGDARSDVYSLTCVLYQALTGRKPYPVAGHPALIHAHLNLDPPVPSRLRPLAAGFDEVIAKGMAKDPDVRYQRAGELAAAAEAGLSRRRGRSSAPPASADRSAPKPPPSGETSVATPVTGVMSLTELNQALERDPDDAVALARRGDAYRREERYTEALRDLDRAVEVAPDRAWIFARRAETLRLMGRHEAAIKDLSRAIEMDPSGSLLCRRARVYGWLGRHDDALADFTHAIELDPADPAPLEGRAETYRRLGRFDEAVADLEAGSALVPDLSWWQFRRAMILADQGRPTESRRALNDAVHRGIAEVTEDPDSPTAAITLAIMRTARRELDDAGQLIGQALDHVPTPSDVVDAVKELGKLGRVVSDGPAGLDKLIGKLRRLGPGSDTSE